MKGALWSAPIGPRLHCLCGEHWQKFLYETEAHDVGSGPQED